MNPMLLGATSWINKQLDRFNLVKDRLIIFSALVYVVGYAVWSINAYINNLGILPAIQLQYFIAGIVPVIVFFVARGVWEIINWFLSVKWPSVVGLEAKGWRGVLRDLISIIFGISFILTIGMSCLSTLKLVDSQNNFFAIIVYTFAISTIFLPPELIKEHMILQWLQLPYKFLILGVFPLLLWLLILASFFTYIYPIWPQELGGIRPRCAYLDVEKSSLSIETVDAIIPPNLVSSEIEVVRSSPVAVYYSGSSTILIKPYYAGEKTDSTYEINKSNIRSIEWCGYY